MHVRACVCVCVCTRVVCVSVRVRVCVCMKNDEIRLATLHLFAPYCVLDRVRATTVCVSLLICVARERESERESPEKTGSSATHAVLLLSNTVPGSLDAATNCVEQMPGVLAFIVGTVCFNVAPLTSQCFCVGVVSLRILLPQLPLSALFILPGNVCRNPARERN